MGAGEVPSPHDPPSWRCTSVAVGSRRDRRVPAVAEGLVVRIRPGARSSAPERRARTPQARPTTLRARSPRASPGVMGVRVRRVDRLDERPLEAREVRHANASVLHTVRRCRPQRCAGIFAPNPLRLGERDGCSSMYACATRSKRLLPEQVLDGRVVVGEALDEAPAAARRYVRGARGRSSAELASEPLHPVTATASSCADHGVGEPPLQRTRHGQSLSGLLGRRAAARSARRRARSIALFGSQRLTVHDLERRDPPSSHSSSIDAPARAQPCVAEQIPDGILDRADVRVDDTGRVARVPGDVQLHGRGRTGRRRAASRCVAVSD